MTHEVSETDLKTIVHVPVGGCDLVLQPCAGIDTADIIVITEHIAFIYLAVGIAHVILQDIGISCEVTFREVVDVTPELTSEQITHCLVIVTVAVVHAETTLKRHVVVDAVVEI